MHVIYGIYAASVYVICSCCGFIVSCPNLTQPNNGVINCSLGDDGVLPMKTLVVSHVTLVMS